MNKLTIKLSPPRFLLLVFSILVATGTLLLKLPFATNGPITWTNALFTATSAATVTGLGVVDTATTFTLFGELVILMLIQVGGLGIMTFAILMFIMLGKKIGLQQRIFLQQSLNQTSIGGIIRLARIVLLFSIGVEVIAALLLCLAWIPQFGMIKGIYYSFFHSVSAFNNAGFSLFSNSLMDFVHHPLVNGVISLLIIIGGLGFTFFIDIAHKRNFKKLTLHNRITLIGTIALILLGTGFIYFFESTNIETLGTMSTPQQLLTSYFQSVSLRTAGFNTIDFAHLNEATLILMCGFMFIGGGSGSTAGGIKITSFVTLVMSTIRFLRGKTDVIILKKTVDLKVVFKSLAIVTISLFVIFIGIIMLLMTEPKIEVFKIVFEVFSAFGTVGLSTGITPLLSTLGKFVIIFIMFFGKIGPLTLFFSLTVEHKVKIRYPSEEILIG